eukprot:Amastigsp_a516516_14.p4 type:complete len:170 gc:universal Amastigsp_a516516_14:1352-843(-)
MLSHGVCTVSLAGPAIAASISRSSCGDALPDTKSLSPRVQTMRIDPRPTSGRSSNSPSSGATTTVEKLARRVQCMRVLTFREMNSSKKGSEALMSEVIKLCAHGKPRNLISDSLQCAYRPDSKRCGLTRWNANTSPKPYDSQNRSRRSIKSGLREPDTNNVSETQQIAR